MQNRDISNNFLFKLNFFHFFSLSKKLKIQKMFVRIFISFFAKRRRFGGAGKSDLCRRQIHNRWR